MEQWNSLAEAMGRLEQKKSAHLNSYVGFYSSWLDGYFRDTWAMAIPMDDHGFHRGDGVFEAVRIHNRAYFDLRAHLNRLEKSAAAIGMKLPKTLSEIEAICVKLARLCEQETAILRLFVTRGPGSFSPSPYDVVGHQIYAAITKLRPPEPKMYAEGCKAMTSTVTAKEQRWSQIKSCNYLQNVMMKKESHEKGYDLSLSVDEKGRVCEGATENLLIITGKGEVKVPKFDYTLRGTTVLQVMSLAEGLKGQGLVKSVELADLSIGEVKAASEAAFVGTTLGVLPVREFDGQPVGSGRPGAVTSRLHELLMQRMSNDSDLRTAF